MFCCCCLGGNHSERCIFSINNLLVLQKTFKCKACGYVVDESRVDEHRQTCTKISEFKGADLFEEQVDIIPELISPRINRNTKFYQCLKCTYALPANLKEIHISLCSNLYETDKEQFKEISKEQYDIITTDYIQCGFCYKFIPQYELNEHSKICPIYIAKKPFRKYCYGDYFEIFVENEMQKKNSNCSLHINDKQNSNNNNEDDLTDTPIPQLKKTYQQPIRINNVVISTSSNNNFKRFGSAEDEVSTPMRLQHEYDAKQQQQKQKLLNPNNNNNVVVVDSISSSNSSSLLTPASTKPIIISPPTKPSTSSASISNNNSRNRTKSDCNTILSSTTSPSPVRVPDSHRHSCGSIDTGLNLNSPVEEARTRARTSLSRGYDVRKHCRGISKSHNTVILLSENELVWKSKGGNEFSSIGLNSISKVLCNKNRVTIKSSDRDLIIDIENENDRNEFVSSLRTLIIPPK